MATVSPQPLETSPPQYRVGDLLIDVGQQRVTRQGVDIALPKLSFDLLLVLTRAAPNVVSNEELMDRVWPGLVVGPETVSQRVKLVRDALQDDAREPRYIAAVRGRGYRMPARPEVVLPIDPAAIPTLVRPAAVTDPPLLAPPASAPPSRSRRRWFVGLITASLSAALLAVSATIWMQRHSAPSAAPNSVTVVALPPRTVAVLPFENISGESSNDYLALGIAEMVLNRLARVQELLVIAHTSSFAFAGQRVDAREIGRRLGARYLVEGSLQREGSQLRVTATLIDAQSGQQVRALSFDRPLKDIFQIQDDIADKVVSALEVRLAGTELARPDPQRGVNLDAYLEYLHGKALLGRWGVKGAAEAIARFSRAIELDPTFAAAYSELAMAQWQSSFLNLPEGLDLSAANAPKISPLIERALALDPELGEAYVMRANLNAATGGNAAEAEAEFRKGLLLAPNYGPGYSLFAETLRDTWNRVDEANEMIDRARLIDPLAPRNHYLKALYLHETSPHEAEALMLQALQVDPDFAPAYTRLATWKWWSGKTAEAVNLIERALRLDPDTPWIHHWACAIYLDLGDPVAARRVALANGTLSVQNRILLALYAGDLRTAGELAYSISPPLGDSALEFEWTLAIRAYAVQTGKLDRASAFLRANYKIPPGHEFEHGVNAGDIALAQLEFGRGDASASGKTRVNLLKAIDDNRKAAEPDLYTGSLLAALAGQQEGALEALSKLMPRIGHMPYWWAVLEREPLWGEKMRSDPAFQALLVRERGYAAHQRALFETMRRNGEVQMRSPSDATPATSR